MSLARLRIINSRYLHLNNIWHHQFSSSNRNVNKLKPTYLNKQTILQWTAYALMISITSGTIYFAYNFQKYYVEPMQEVFKEPQYSLDEKTRDEMMKKMASKFDENMEFITNKNELVNGMDVLQSDKFFLLYFGYPSCNDKCNDILKTIKLSLKSKKLEKSINLLSILYIDLNIFDSPDKLNKYFSETLEIKPDSDINIIGLIPKDRDTLRELMDSFYIFINKHQGNGENMELNHSNILYFVDKDGLLYELLGGEHEITEENIIDRTNKLLFQSESTFMGKLRNILSLTFQTSPIRQMPDRHVPGRSVPQ